MIFQKEQPVMHVREFISADIPQMIRIWNEIVEDGNAFPQEELLTEETGAAFFTSQTRTAVAEENSVIYGLYILHPNNI
jgi:L-amino acid N-acyltransferase YncA